MLNKPHYVNSKLRWRQFVSRQSKNWVWRTNSSIVCGLEQEIQHEVAALAEQQDSLLAQLQQQQQAMQQQKAQAEVEHQQRLPHPSPNDSKNKQR